MDPKRAKKADDFGHGAWLIWLALIVTILSPF
jgi:hypothetical protein